MPRLARIAAGQGALSSADNGPAVSAVQQALIAIGFEMVRHGQDGRFGDETREAINLFRSRRGMPAGDLTARALGELDQIAPPPGATEEHYFDYERLFEDGYLDVTIGIGYDEGGSHTQKLQTARDWLAGHGFEAGDAEPGQPELHRLRRDVTYPNRTGGRTTREVIVRVSLIAPGSGAAAQFGAGSRSRRSPSTRATPAGGSARTSTRTSRRRRTSSSASGRRCTPPVARSSRAGSSRTTT